MNSPINFAIQRVKNFSIPPQILQFLLNGRRSTGFRASNNNVDGLIREKIILGRLLPDSNILAPTETEITCSPNWYETLEDGSKILRVPASKTKNKRIMTASSILYIPGIAAHPSNAVAGVHLAGFMKQSGSLTQALSDVKNSHSRETLVSTTNLDVIGNNTILVSSHMRFMNNTVLTCRVEGDENFSFLKPAQYDLFAEMVELATKSYIYNQYSLDISQGIIKAGREASDFRDKVQEYQSAEEEYKTLYKERWKNSLSANDPKRKLNRINLATLNLMR